MTRPSSFEGRHTVISIVLSIASVRTGEAKSVVQVCQLLTDIRRRRPLNQALYELVIVLIVVNLLIFVLLIFLLLPQSFTY